jgi:hypothetical protein
MNIQVYSIHGPRGSGGATIGKTTFIYVCIENKIFSTTSRPISIKLHTNHPWMKRIKKCSNKRPGPHQRGYNLKNGVRSLKSLLENH